MTEKEIVERDFSLTFDFLRYAVDHPEILDEIPDGAELEFIATDMVIHESEFEKPKEGSDPPKAVLVARRVFTPLRSTEGTQLVAG